MIISRNHVQSSIEAALSRSPAVALLGPRQVGKTTMARALAAALVKSGRDVVYLDLERAADRRRLDDTGRYLMARAGGLTILDEVHRVPELFAELRGVIDERRSAGERNGQFLLLGSASLELISRATESLAGRIAYVEMRTLSALEVVPTHAQLETLWLRGGFPDSLTAEGDNASLAWRTDFVRSYLERDVPMFAPRMPATTIGRLWTMLAHSQGTLLNSARLAQALGVSAPMVGRYLDLLEDLLLVRRLAPWHGNIAKRLVKSPKVYLRDSGLVHALLEIETLHQLLGHPVVGMSWEGFVIENLLAAAGPGSIPLHFRTADGAEIDLLLERAGQPAFAIEIKRSSAPVPSPGFYRAAQAIGAQHKVLVAPVGDSYRTKDDVVVMDVLAAVKLLSR